MRGFFIDLETSGLLKKGNPDFLAQPGITQIGIVVVDDFSGEHANWSSLVNPEIAPGAWEPKAIETTGIGPEQVKDAPTFFEVFPKIAELAKGCDFWGGYNSGFDKGVLWHQLQRFGFQCSFPWPPAEVDVMKMVKNHFEQQGKRGISNMKQSEAYERLFDEPLTGAHDAMADIRACVRIYKELTK